MQLFNMFEDPKESMNLVEKHPDQVDQLLNVLASEISAGRCTPGAPLANDREIAFLPGGVVLPSGN